MMISGVDVIGGACWIAKRAPLHMQPEAGDNGSLANRSLLRAFIMKPRWVSHSLAITAGCILGYMLSAYECDKSHKTDLNRSIIQRVSLYKSLQTGQHNETMDELRLLIALDVLGLHELLGKFDPQSMAQYNGLKVAVAFFSDPSMHISNSALSNKISKILKLEPISK